MMFDKPMARAGLGAALTFALTLSLAACDEAAGAPSAVTPAADPSGSEVAVVEMATGPDALVAAVAPVAAPAVATTGLSLEEVQGLYWMREEEKLARDVYLAMFSLWGQPTFENIAASEARHMDAVLGLIVAYGLDDPVVDDTPGAFTDPQLAALYEELVERGSASLVEALTVGALIEDLDIRDLEESLAATDRADIVRVYSSLLRGSQNHLRAFTSQLGAAGAEYQPVYHSEEEIAALLAGAAGGRRRGAGRSSG